MICVSIFTHRATILVKLLALLVQNRTRYFQTCTQYIVIMHCYIYIQTNNSFMANKHKRKERTERKGRERKKGKM